MDWAIAYSATIFGLAYAIPKVWSIKMQADMLSEALLVQSDTSSSGYEGNPSGSFPDLGGYQ